MPRVLFVDDEPKVLTGLENALFRHRGAWDLTFATDPRAALQIVEGGTVDVIVSDMRMPEMDGAQLLTAVQEKQPQVVRIVLSAFAEFEATLRAVPVAHHFLLKPCDADTLWHVVQRACRLRDSLGDTSLQHVVKRVNGLPPAPRMYSELTRLLADPKTGIEQCLRVIERDVTLCARVVRLASTAALGFRGRVSNLQGAAVFLGTNMLRNLVLSVEAFEAFQGTKAATLLAAEQKHAALTGAIAKALAPQRYMGENACLAGILHDLGSLLLASHLPVEGTQTRALARRNGITDHDAELKVMGASHAGVGAWMLSTWGLPYSVVEAVAHHHSPRSVPHRVLDELGLVHVASALASELAGTRQEPLDLRYLEAMGVQDSLPEWRKVASELANSISV